MTKKHTASGVRKEGINPASGQAYKAKKSGAIKAEHRVARKQETTTTTTATTTKATTTTKTTAATQTNTVKWPKHLSKKAKGVYTCRIEHGGRLIIVRECQHLLF